MKKILIVGDEPRQEYLFRLFQERGREVWKAEDVEGTYDVILLPVPAHLTKYYMEKSSGFFTKEQIVFGCGFTKEMKEKCPAGLIDYMAGDEVAYQNAIATAEGAITEAILHSPINLHRSKSLVLGYGRCGQVLADKLLGLHSIVTVMERNGVKRAKAESMGCITRDFSNFEDLEEYDFVFNTVPAPVLGKKMIAKLSPEVTIIDIASGGVGVDYEYCKKMKINANLCLGLPGKYAPKSSAAILLKVIEKALGE